MSRMIDQSNVLDGSNPESIEELNSDIRNQLGQDPILLLPIL